MPKKNKIQKHSKRRTKQNNPARKPEAFFEVEEGESIARCLERIEEAGCRPVRRLEEPVFQEVEENGEKVYKPVEKKIKFEVKPVKTER